MGEVAYIPARIWAEAHTTMGETAHNRHTCGMAIDPALQRFVALAVADLSARVDVPREEILVVRAEATTWSDMSLGCPQPGMRYPQVPQDGARIHLKIGDQVYRYHTGGHRTEPFLCEQHNAKQAPPTRRLEPRFRPQ
jgi:hypothetical protein